MKTKKIYYLSKEDAKKIMDEEALNSFYLELEEEDIIIEERAFQLHSKRRLKRKSGDVVRYDWWISLAPKMYISGFEHDVYIDKIEEYEALFRLAIRDEEGEAKEIDKKVLEHIEYAPLYVTQKQMNLI